MLGKPQGLGPIRYRTVQYRKVFEPRLGNALIYGLVYRLVHLHCLITILMSHCQLFKRISEGGWRREKQHGLSLSQLDLAFSGRSNCMSGLNSFLGDLVFHLPKISDLV